LAWTNHQTKEKIGSFLADTKYAHRSLIQKLLKRRQWLKIAASNKKNFRVVSAEVLNFLILWVFGFSWITGRLD
jgi:hypothetical protein